MTCHLCQRSTYIYVGSDPETLPWPTLIMLSVVPRNISVWLASIHSHVRGHNRRDPAGEKWQATGGLPAQSHALPKSTGELLVFSHLCLLLTENHMEQNQAEGMDNGLAYLQLERVFW